jgi:gamma-glutamyl-gamma-aminobutyrate hydrolase PuuD
MLNVALGGTLVQHLANTQEHQVEDARRSFQACARSCSRRGDGVSTAIGEGEHPVNSRHHQAIGKPAPGLQITASAPCDGVVEAAEIPELRFVVGVQWHPEDRIRCETDRRLFESFARAVAGS